MGERERLGLAAGATLAVMILPASFGHTALDSGDARLAATSAPAPREMTANVELHFVQEDGPSSGHVRVELTPTDRPLSFFEARSAAQQAFLETLKEPGLGDELKRIRIVVRMAPEEVPAGEVQSFLFLRTGAKNWSVMAAD